MVLFTYVNWGYENLVLFWKKKCLPNRGKKMPKQYSVLIPLSHHEWQHMSKPQRYFLFRMNHSCTIKGIWKWVAVVSSFPNLIGAWKNVVILVVFLLERNPPGLDQLFTQYLLHSIAQWQWRSAYLSKCASGAKSISAGSFLLNYLPLQAVLLN